MSNISFLCQSLTAGCHFVPISKSVTRIRQASITNLPHSIMQSFPAAFITWQMLSWGVKRHQGRLVFIKLGWEYHTAPYCVMCIPCKIYSFEFVIYTVVADLLPSKILSRCQKVIVDRWLCWMAEMHNAITADQSINAHDKQKCQHFHSGS